MIFQSKFKGLKFFYVAEQRFLKFEDFTYETGNKGEIEALMQSFKKRCDVWPVDDKDDLRKIRDMPSPEMRTTIEPSPKIMRQRKKEKDEEIEQAGASASPTAFDAEPKRRGRPKGR
jgi:hypothetical protein